MAEENGPLKMDRSDRATRKFLDGLDELKDGLTALDREVVALTTTLKEHYVSYKAMWGFLGAFVAILAVLIGLVRWMTDDIRKENSEARAEQTQVLKTFAGDIASIRSQVDGSQRLRESEEKSKRRKER